MRTIFAVMRNLIITLAVLCARSIAMGQGYPSKPIKLVVPGGPGTGGDTIARILVGKLEKELKVPVFIENKEGAGALVATQYTAKAPPDGYTIQIISNALTITPLMYKTAPYDAVKDFTPISRVALMPETVVTSVSSPYKTLHEMVEFLRKNPSRSNFATPGKGSPGHLEGARLMQHLGVVARDVPYRVTNQALMDTISGQVAFYVVVQGTSLPQAMAGKLRILATGGTKRSDQIPDVPTIGEALGIPAYEASVWFGLAAPAGTPPDIVSKLHIAVSAALDSPEVRAGFARAGAEVAPLDPEQTASLVRSDRAMWTTLIQSIDIKRD